MATFTEAAIRARAQATTLWIWETESKYAVYNEWVKGNDEIKVR